MERDRFEGIHNRVANVVSILFHPLFLPLYMLAILISAPTVIAYLPLRLKLILLAVIFVNTVLMPALLIVLLWYRKYISSINVEKREERTILLLMTALLYLITTVMLWRLNLPGIIKSFIASVTILLFVIAVINLRSKISIHAAGAGAMTAIIILLSTRLQVSLVFLVIPSVAISGLVLHSRLQLNAHKPGEVYWGYLTGAVVVSFVLSLFHFILRGSF